MGGVRLAGLEIEHQFGVAVVGGDQHFTAGLLDGRQDAAERGVDRLDRLDGGIEVAGMADHVRVGQIADDHVVVVAFDGLGDFVGHHGRAHLGLQVIGAHVGRRGHENAILELERFLDAAVEEEGDVGVLLGFGDAQLVQPARGDVGAEHVAQPFGRKCHRHVELGVVFGQADERR